MSEILTDWEFGNVLGRLTCDARSLEVKSILRAHDAALRAALAAAERERDEARRAIESCTPGGSEFVNDPKACAAFITGARDRAHEMVKRGVVRAKAAESRAERLAEAMRELLAAFVCLHNAASTGDAEQWVEVQAARAVLAEVGK